MITYGLLIIGAILLIAAMVVFLLNLAKAPDAVEDDTGFHYIKETKTGRSRYYSARSAAARPTKTSKPFKAHSSPAS